MSILKTGAVALISLGVLAGCETTAGGSGNLPIEAGLSYDDFQRQYGTDQATMLAMDANNNGIISENEWQAAGY